MPRFQSNSANKDYWPALVQDLDNQEELMDTFYKEDNSNFMPRKLNQERNDRSYR